MAAGNLSYRRDAMARVVVRAIAYHFPDQVLLLCGLFWRALQDSQPQLKADGDHVGFPVSKKATGLIASACALWRVGCPAVEKALFAHLLALGDQSRAENDDDADAFSDGYFLRWIPGESLSAFRRRAEAQFRTRKKSESITDGTIETIRFNEKHVTWFVEYQVNCDRWDRIAKAHHVFRRDLKRAVKGVAALLGVELRKAAIGRPPGIRKPIVERPHRPRRKKRRRGYEI